jgi:uncharacterized protein
VQDHKLFLQTGYGLEAVLPDALCKRIIDEQITPRFKAGDFGGGLTAGVTAILAATKGEYQGNGRTVAEKGSYAELAPFFIFAFIFLFFTLAAVFGRRGGFVYTGVGRTGGGWYRSSGWSGGGGGFGGFSGGGGFGGGGGGGFSGGGGSSGGGGAGGSW